jgi:hypothetical protein
VTGPAGLNESLTVSYSNNVNVGTATASASYAGSANYLPSNDSETFQILAWNAQGHGFYAPVGVENTYWVSSGDTLPSPGSSTIWNTVKGGSTVPLKFNVYAGTVEQTALSAVSSFTAKSVSCTTGAEEDAVDFTTAGSTSLRYDTTAEQFIQNWKTPTTVSCFRATVTFADGSSLSAFFKTKK